MTPPFENRGAPTIWLKTVLKWPKRQFFCFFGWGTADIGMRRHFFGWDCSPDTELE